MASSVFGDNVSSYAPGVSTGMPTDAVDFLQNFTTKKGKVKRKAFKEFKESGGDVQGVRDILEGKVPADFEGPLPQYTAGQHVMQNMRDATANLDNVKKGKNNRPKVGSFIDEFATARGKISNKDMRAFEEAGGNLKALDRKLQKGNFTREEMLNDPSVLNERETAIQTGQSDYYTGEAGKRFLDTKLRQMGATPVEDETSSTAPEEPVFFDPTPEEPSVAPGTGGGTDPNPGTGTGTDPSTEGDTDPDPTTPTTGDGTDPSPIPILETGNEYPTTDPGSGFPTNPGRHAGGAFTPYKENIANILKHTDERLDRIRNNPDRLSPADTLTQKYTQDLIDGGVLPGTPGYKSAADKDKERLAGDLAIKDAFSAEEADRRRASRKADLTMLRNNANKRRDAKDEDLRDRMAAMLELQAANRLNDRPNSIMAYMGTPLESGGPAPIDLTKSEKEETETENKKFKLPGLPDKVKGDKIKGPGLYKSGKSAPDFEKNPSFDGDPFKEFLEKAKAMRPGGRPGMYGPGQGPTSNNPVNRELNTLYNKLRDEGMSEDDMLKAAQTAGLTNIRTGKEGKSDFQQMIDAYENDFYKGFDGKQLKSEQDLYRWYKGQGGTKKLDRVRKAAGYKNYDSKDDAKNLAQFLTNDLKKSGIRQPVDEKSMKAFNKQMNKIENMFGGKFKFSTYQEALEGNKASDVNDWVKNYIDLGGGVGRRVTDAIGL